MCVKIGGLDERMFLISGPCRVHHLPRLLVQPLQLGGVAAPPHLLPHLLPDPLPCIKIVTTGARYTNHKAISQGLTMVPDCLLVPSLHLPPEGLVHSPGVLLLVDVLRDDDPHLLLPPSSPPSNPHHRCQAKHCSRCFGSRG